MLGLAGAGLTRYRRCPRRGTVVDPDFVVTPIVLVGFVVMPAPEDSPLLVGPPTTAPAAGRLAAPPTAAFGP